MKSWLFLGIAIFAEVVATSGLKASEGFTKRWPSLLVIGMALIITGVAVINLFSKSVAH
ncbi:MAG: SMR family transporter [Marinobacter sp.]|uniref:SMR family transporter n=1 Tax=Marinobacter sp. TaxID=50741 RepID=UPI00396E54ED